MLDLRKIFLRKIDNRQNPMDANLTTETSTIELSYKAIRNRISKIIMEFLWTKLDHRFLNPTLLMIISLLSFLPIEAPEKKISTVHTEHFTYTIIYFALNETLMKTRWFGLLNRRELLVPKETVWLASLRFSSQNEKKKQVERGGAPVNFH